MVFELIQAIAKRRGGEYSPDSAVWTQSPGTIVDYELTIPERWVGYLFQVSGYTSGPAVNLKFIDQDGILRWEWTDLLDTQKDWPVLPMLEKAYRGTIRFRFTNNSASNRTIGWATEVLLIPDAERDAFEQDVQALADLVPLLRWPVLRRLEVRAAPERAERPRAPSEEVEEVTVPAQQFLDRFTRIDEQLEAILRVLEQIRDKL